MYTLYIKAIKLNVPVNFDSEYNAVEYGVSYKSDFIVYYNGIACGYYINGKYMNLDEYYESGHVW